MTQGAFKLEVPRAGATDIEHSVIKGFFGMIPMGSVVSEVFGALFSSPLEKRKEKWMEEVSKALVMLWKTRKITIEDLKQNPVFIDTLQQASIVAMRNSNEEKKECLKNAILYSALHKDFDESLQMMFLNFVDVLTPWHLKFLKFLADPKKWFLDNNRNAPEYFITSSSWQVLTEAYPELKEKKEFCTVVTKDLYAKGLLGTDSIFSMVTGSGVYGDRTTVLGKQFIDYICKPKV